MELNKNINYGIINDTQSIILDIVYDYIEVDEVGDSYIYIKYSQIINVDMRMNMVI